jgi:hypothetical protein
MALKDIINPNWTHTRLHVIEKYGTRNSMPVSSYMTKTIITGDRLKHLQYTTPIYRNNRKPNDDEIRFKPILREKNDNKRSSFSLNRSRNDLFDTIETNKTKYTKILTLTTRQPILERQQFIQLFRLFRERFQRFYKVKMKYIGIIERQTERGKKENNSGSLHIHLIIFMDQYFPFKELKKLWTNYGSLDIKKVDNKGMAKYLAKYLTKQNVENIHESGTKTIFKSQGLKKPTIYYDAKINKYLYDTNGELLIDQRLYRVMATKYKKLTDNSIIRYFEYSIYKETKKKRPIISIDMGVST